MGERAEERYGRKEREESRTKGKDGYKVWKNGQEIDMEDWRNERKETGRRQNKRERRI
jgi:hypothetical protein